MKKILIIRFSSLGDIAQCLGAAQALKNNYPNCEIHWATRSDFKGFLEQFSCINQIWDFDRKQGFLGLFHFASQLRSLHFDLVYDAHSNLRSTFLRVFLFRFSTKIIRRSKERLKRFFLFYLKINFFNKPYKGAHSFLLPLQAYIQPDSAPLVPLKPESTNKSQSEFDILLAPSAAWPLKKWPEHYWLELIKLIQKRYPGFKIGLLGGPEDQFQKLLQPNITNLAGQLSWSDTTKSISKTQLLISGDTGALHIADLLGTKNFALIGPTAFGYTSRQQSKVIETDLSCKPCSKDGRGRCHNRTYKKCLFDLTPELVFAEVEKAIKQ